MIHYNIYAFRFFSVCGRTVILAISSTVFVRASEISGFNNNAQLAKLLGLRPRPRWASLQRSPIPPGCAGGGLTPSRLRIRPLIIYSFAGPMLFTFRRPWYVCVCACVCMCVCMESFPMLQCKWCPWYLYVAPISSRDHCYIHVAWKAGRCPIGICTVVPKINIISFVQLRGQQQ